MKKSELEKLMKKHLVFTNDIDSICDFISEVLEAKAKHLEETEPYATNTIMSQYLRDFKKFPKNFVVNISVWHDNDKGYDFGKCNKFVYDDGTDPKIAKMRHCPAVDKNGHSTGVKCSQCGWCFKGNYGRITAVYAH